LRRRSPYHYEVLVGVKMPDAHPLFTIVGGKARSWERGSDVRV
jgi:hypothetical protein